MITSRDQDDDVAANWTTREIADRIDRGDPEALAEVLRPLAARLANQASTVTDPRSVLLDLSRVVDSIHAAVATVVSDNELGADSDMDAPSASAESALRGSVAALYQLGNNI
jgi:hypothetical protein